MSSYHMGTIHIEAYEVVDMGNYFTYSHKKTKTPTRQVGEPLRRGRVDKVTNRAHRGKGNTILNKPTHKKPNPEHRLIAA